MTDENNFFIQLFKITNECYRDLLLPRYSFPEKYMMSLEHDMYISLSHCAFEVFFFFLFKINMVIVIAVFSDA